VEAACFTIFAVSPVGKTEKIVKHHQGQKSKFTYSFLRRFYIRPALLAWRTTVHFTPVQANRILFGPTFTSGACAISQGADPDRERAHLAPNLSLVGGGEHAIA
jgi:hypothetical protein